MLLTDMVTAVNNLVDDVVDTPTITSWLNSGKDKMAQRANAVFPDLDPSDTNTTFVFDAKWHYCAVLYASAQYKAQDSALTEVQNFMNQFDEMVNEFATKYRVPTMYRDDDYCQQYIGTTSADSIIFQATGDDGFLAIGPTYVNDPNYVNAADGTSQTYAITKDTFIPFASQLRVYINDQQLPGTWYQDNGDNTFTIAPLYTVQSTDAVTAVWNEVAEQLQPPYEWWARE